MYMPVTVSPAGMGYFRSMDAKLQEAEFYPPPYNTDSPIDLSDVYSIAAAGLGGYRGMGLFDSMDFTTWGWQEYLAIGAAAYFGLKLIGDIGRGASTVRKAARARSTRRARKQRLKEELAAL